MCNYKNGNQESIQIRHFENGQVWTNLLYMNGKLWEVYSNFNKNGNEMNKGTLRGGNGTLLLYDENGKLLEEESYLNGKRKQRKKCKDK